VVHTLNRASVALALALMLACATEARSDEAPAPSPQPTPPSPPPAPPVEPPAAPPQAPSEPQSSSLAPRLPVIDLDALEKSGAIIGSIRIESVQIFDPRLPGEDKAVYRLVNKLHIVTRPNTIRHQLLFAEGEPFVKARLEETERNLRALAFLQDALVAVESVVANRANILVRTQDSWTTRLGVRFGSAGGTNTSGVALTEVNLLGTGKRIRLDYENGIDRTTTALSYDDPNVLGSRWRMNLSHENSSDGKADSFFVQRPFYSIETRWAAGIDASRTEEITTVFEEGNDVAEFQHHARDGEANVGWSPGARDGRASRWFGGYVYDEDTFEPNGDLPAGFPPDQIPEDRIVSGPEIVFQWVHQRYIKVRYFERFSRSEDFNLGGVYSVKTVFSRKSLSGTENEILYNLNASQGFQTGFASYLFGNAQIKGRAGSGKEQGSGHFDFTHYYTGWPIQTFLFKVEADRVVNGAATDQLLLGGDSGLRGFSTRRFEGPNRFLVNIEDRIHFEREYFKVLRLGLAGFIDVGNAWGGTRVEDTCIREFDGTRVCGPMEFPNKFGNLKADIGVSILGDINRASGAGFLRLNIAYPINGAKYDEATILISFGRSGAF
jgi:hypothetical protein